MNFNQGYKVVFVNCKLKSLDFFSNMPGFILQEEIEIQGRQYPILQLNQGDLIMLVEKEAMVPETIVLKTDDCIRDYHLFRQKQLDTITKPRYVDNGLELCFSDPSGNRFILLEERDYSEV